MNAFKDPDLEKRRKVWQRYVPNKVEVLLIAEAPPTEDRYFYYPESTSHDGLFINTIRAIYKDYRDVDVSLIRKDKPQLLKRFKQDGFLLIDALENRIPSKMAEKERVNLIRANESNLAERLSKLNGDFFTFIIKKSVFKALTDKSKSQMEWIWREPLPFPSQGHQAEYREELQKGLSARRFFSTIDESDITSE